MQSSPHTQTHLHYTHHTQTIYIHIYIYIYIRQTQVLKCQKPKPSMDPITSNQTFTKPIPASVLLPWKWVIQRH